MLATLTFEAGTHSFHNWVIGIEMGTPGFNEL